MIHKTKFSKVAKFSNVTKKNVLPHDHYVGMLFIVFGQGSFREEGGLLKS